MFFPDDEALQRYVEEQVREVLPPDWVCNFRLQGAVRHLPRSAVTLSDMEWKIAPQQESATLEDHYLLRVTADRSMFMILYGNTDAGPMRPEDWADMARILYARRLDLCPLAQFVADTLAHYPPNTSGLS